ncbi:DNA polymerase III subunits gamma and tau [Yersinia aldovae ATCC 35236]|uniref:Uncharacterized protein n=1 Tax=Yersinia aldovae TaxID=29483 RepID=A0A0T9UL39_YERAL|nr:DNA polymerase III subunits gamma and tau [Yersinia aldovae ATCC 35236]CNJ09895.1 Uncharacterised protein [Yersinia aldovae]CNL49710.1 Uncharacterised protein [Yersinia aldovae]
MEALNSVQANLVAGGDGAPATLPNAVGTAAIVGAIMGIPAGPIGVMGGALGMGIGTAIGATASVGIAPAGDGLPMGMDPRCADREFIMNNHMLCN